MPSYDFVRLALLPAPSQETRDTYRHDVSGWAEALGRDGVILTAAPCPGAPGPNDAAMGTPGFLIAYADLIGATFEAAATAWLDGAPGRRLVIAMGDIEIEAGTADDFQRLFVLARVLDDARHSRKRADAPLRAHDHAFAEEYHA